ncbi:peptidylprolyl isomerase [Sporosarcina cyprini]|uniref:peptidylprolyl isomerase n=1 Tax=Sporosarcina cyprini TaxID=2910523 RepID=UPI001EE058A5|nr:peptidylprolyl isomerase [Sporosarcina cyprini]MCG3088671.1 peptidylprolyl isomerase [Sporosarcina cyprini]
MKKTLIAVSLATSVLALSACSDKKASDEVIASTKYGNITQADFYEEMKDAIGVQVVENMLLQKAIEHEYKVDDKELEEAIKQQKDMYGDNFDLYLQQNGITEKFFEKNVKSQLLQKKLVDSLKVTDEQIKTGIENAKTELHARHILVKDEKTAKEVLQKLKDGGDFAKLAKEYSTEDKANETGGDLGWFGQGKMVPEFEAAAYKLKKGEISEPVKTSFGYHIIELLDTRKVEIEKTDEELKAEVEDNLTRAAFEARLKELLEKADVEIKEEEFQHALDAYLPVKEEKAKK